MCLFLKEYISKPLLFGYVRLVIYDNIINNFFFFIYKDQLTI